MRSNTKFTFDRGRPNFCCRVGRVGIRAKFVDYIYQKIGVLYNFSLGYKKSMILTIDDRVSLMFFYSQLSRLEFTVELCINMYNPGILVTQLFKLGHIYSPITSIKVGRVFFSLSVRRPNVSAPEQELLKFIYIYI